MHDTGAEARTRAQIAYTRAVEHLNGELSQKERQFLLQQHVRGLAADGRLVAVFGCERDKAKAARLLSRVAAELKHRELAAGILAETDPGLAAARLAKSPRPRRAAPQILYLPKILVCMTMPHRAVRGGEFTRKNGGASLTMLAKREIGLPYGIYPRLWVAHLCTAAIHARSRRLEVQGSVRTLLQLMEISASGGPKGPGHRASDQLRRLCATQFCYDSYDNERERGENTPLVESWVREGPGFQIELGERFYRLLAGSAVPLDIGLVRELRTSPLAFDVAAWISYRAATLQRETLIPWAALEAQFGGQYKTPRQFRANFRTALSRVKAAWVGIAAEAEDTGLRLKVFAPSVQMWAEQARPRRVQPE